MVKSAKKQTEAMECHAKKLQVFSRLHCHDLHPYPGHNFGHTQSSSRSGVVLLVMIGSYIGDRAAHFGM